MTTIKYRRNQNCPYWIVFISIFALFGCATADKVSLEEHAKQIALAKEANIDHQVPTTFEEAVKNPGNLGLYSPLGTSTSMTSNNTGLQTTQNTPTLATPFVALQNATTDEALKAIELESKKNPRNIQILFVRTRILIEQGQLESARQALLTFIDKYPEVPEPYNNLAVLYASVGKLEQARDYLELCVKLAPNYAIALQNLGDIYTLIAANYYDKAFKQNRRMTEADKKRKLAEAITAK